MYFDPQMSLAFAQQRQADLVAAAQHARDVRLTTRNGGRRLRLRLHRAPRLTAVLTPPTPATPLPA